MEARDIIGLIVLIVILFVAFRVGAVLMKVVLGLLAIGIVVWLIMSLLGNPAL